MIYRATITVKGKISFRAAFAAKNMKSNSKAKIELIGSGTQTCLISQYRLVFTTFTGGWLGRWVAGEMRIKAKPQASQAESVLGLSLTIYKIKKILSGEFMKQ